MEHICIIQEDITTLKVDAVVNAANNTLLGGGGVDGAIHKAAGPQLRTYCETLGGCPTGDARITPGFDLPARHVIHTVGPVWKGGHHGEEGLLRACYRRSLELATEHRLQTVAFPSISTGAYGYPIKEAARVAIETLSEFVTEQNPELLISLCTFSEEDQVCYQEALTRWADHRMEDMDL